MPKKQHIVTSMWEWVEYGVQALLWQDNFVHRYGIILAHVEVKASRV